LKRFGTEVQLEVQRCRGAEVVQRWCRVVQRCRGGAEVQKFRCRDGCAGAEGMRILLRCFDAESVTSHG
jgi:hypothetical protein